MTPIGRAWTLIELQRCVEDLAATRAVLQRLRKQWDQDVPLVWSVLA